MSNQIRQSEAFYTLLDRELIKKKIYAANCYFQFIKKNFLHMGSGNVM